MLLAASESAVTKKPRLRLMMRRSSSDNPFGSFHRAMSRFMLTSCGIQWLAQVDRYFSQAHLYLNGTSWLTSVWPLMMRLSAAVTRRALGAVFAAPTAGRTGCGGAMATSVNVCSATEAAGIASGEWLTVRFAGKPLFAEFDGVGVTSSSQVNIGFPVLELCEPGCGKQSVRSHHGHILLLNCIGVLSENADISFFIDYWQASHVGSSI